MKGPLQETPISEAALTISGPDDSELLIALLKT